MSRDRFGLVWLGLVDWRGEGPLLGFGLRFFSAVRRYLVEISANHHLFCHAIGPSFQSSLLKEKKKKKTARSIEDVDLADAASVQNDTMVCA